MNKFRPQEPLVFEGILSEQWDHWRLQLELYLMATESAEKAQAIQTTIFLTCIGKQGLEIYNTFTFSNEEDKMKLKPVVERFEAYCKPRKNITLVRHNFLTPKQHHGVSFDHLGIWQTQGFFDQGDDHNRSRRQPTKGETFTCRRSHARYGNLNCLGI